MEINGKQIKDGTVCRADLNIDLTGQAVIRRVINSSDIALSSTGVDSGTGDVTISLTTTGITAGEWVVATYDNKGRATSGRALANSDLPASGVTPGSYTKVTVNTQGIITLGASLAAGDLPSGSTYYIQSQAASAQAASLWVSGTVGGTELRAYNDANTYYVGIDAPASLAANYKFVLPGGFGSSGDVLQTDGSGNLSWLGISSIYIPIASNSTVTGTKTFSTGLRATGPVNTTGMSGTGLEMSVVSNTGTITVYDRTNTVYAAAQYNALTHKFTIDGSTGLLTVSSLGTRLDTAVGINVDPRAASEYLYLSHASTTRRGVTLEYTGATVGVATLLVTSATYAGSDQILLQAASNSTARFTVYADGAVSIGNTLAVSGVTTLSGRLVTAASTTSAAGLNIPSGTAPTTPVSGDVWYTGTYLFFRNSAGTRGFVQAASTITANVLPKSAGGYAIGASNITDDGTTVTVASALTATGTLTINTGITGLLKATSGVVSAAGASDITGVLLTGLSTATNAVITASDSILSGMGKLQAQISAGGGGGAWSSSSGVTRLTTNTDRVDVGASPLTTGKLNTAGGSITNIENTAYRVLLHFDGNNGSRRILDSGAYNYPVRARGNNYYTFATISTAQSKFNGSSGLFNGSTWAEIPARYSIGTGDFTLDFHIYFTSVSGTQTVLDWGNAASGLVLSYSAGTWTFTIAGTATTFSFTPTVSTWYHIGISRTSNSVRFFVAGTKTGTTQTASGSVTATSSNNLNVGALVNISSYVPSNLLTAYVDELRFLTSSAYTSDSNITVPTAAYEPHGLRIASGSDTYDDGSMLVGDGKGMFTPQKPPVVHTLTFCLGETSNNATKYFYASRGLGTTQDDQQRSGSGNGLGNQLSCSPAFSPCNGRITKAVLVVQGAATNNGTVTYPVAYRCDLYRVGWTAEHDPNINGGSPVTLNFQIPQGYTVGTYSVGATNARIPLMDLNIPVNIGDPIGLKFIPNATASTVAITQMAFVMLVIEETF